MVHKMQNNRRDDVVPVYRNWEWVPLILKLENYDNPSGQRAGTFNRIHISYTVKFEISIQLIWFYNVMTNL